MIAAFKRAIELDPAYAEPYAGLAFAYCLDFQNHWADTPDALDLAAHFATQAIERDPTNPTCIVSPPSSPFGNAILRQRKPQQKKAADKPELRPCLRDAQLIELYLGNPLAAIPHIERAMRLDPAFTHQYMHFLWFSLSGGGSIRCRGGRLPQADPSYAKEADLSRAFLASGSLATSSRLKRSTSGHRDSSNCWD